MDVSVDPRVRHVDPVDLLALDPAALSAAGVQLLVLPEPVSFGSDDERDLRFLRLLREAVSYTLRIEWRARAVPFDLTMVGHLPPPLGDEGREWRDTYRFGLCYYQRGPNFVLLKDVRGEGGARYRIDDEQAMSVWPELEPVRHRDSLTPAARELCALLEEEELLMRRGDWVTHLPYRLRRWPVPFDAI
ncbi:DUF5825 family protein [Amycolatopsis sp. 195334CR]|uniref:DUF5825 family protein n=1 Tax=Amycolatopsis sp. 195334CR TaxID=2814588 RepID=UPI001A8FF9EF|nr:DUF5825 family protein [Amycolatopsis sp. 195334CR]MBN6041002.1 hypothetical protein [Amycolatopsis sp. 195334CR]